MLALRVHEARCQNWRACVLARSWVTAIRSGSAAHGAPAPVRDDRVVGGDRGPVEGLRGRPDGLASRSPAPLAGSRSSRCPPRGRRRTRVMMVTFWPSSRRLAIRPPQERAASSGCGEMKTWLIAAEDSIGERSPARPADGPGACRSSARRPGPGRIGPAGARRRTARARRRITRSPSRKTTVSSWRSRLPTGHDEAAVVRQLVDRGASARRAPRPRPRWRRRARRGGYPTLPSPITRGP